ncbi:sialic acid-binding Ig-like lectin 12 isoform X2 [Carcharodon carcharias]|uniref:sialic acid-binding Ig-like lectin 12 isoform X2 n=1 Tax=Carcharodon carcharias TaxID=13397 RepID=UPI001B7F59E6|nr:sialic acid-binding Ig-like lectin 12 isoform X2 [Carcharodon carcharias]
MQLLLKLLLILQTGGGQIWEVTQPRLVSVLRGESVTINCTFMFAGTDSDWIHVIWYKRSPGASNISMGRTNSTCIPNVTPGGLNHCISSLKTENFSSDLSDYNYTCIVKVPNIKPPLERSGQGTWIQIYEPPEVSTVDGTLVAGQKSSLTCSIKRLNSGDISFTWACYGINGFANNTTPTSKITVNGTSVATSQLEFIPKVTDHGTVCTCQINHVTFRQPVTNKIKLHVMYGPQNLTIMYRLNNSDSYQPWNNSPITVPMDSFLELRCSVDSHPASIVIWGKNSENYTEMLQSTAELNSSKVKITNYQSTDGEVYWCMANNSYGWRNASVWIKANEKVDPLLLILVPAISVIGFSVVVTICLCLICKRQMKDAVNVSMELSPKTMDRSANCNSELDTIYALVRRNNLPNNPKHATDCVIEYNNIGEEDEEVSYADIVIHNPKRQYHNQQPKHLPDVKEKNTRNDFKYIHSSSPHKHVDDTSEYSAVRISRQDLRTA